MRAYSEDVSEVAGPSGFQRERQRLFGLAYNMLGSRMDAEDVLQDAYLRWQGADTESIRTPEAWLTTVVTRLALDRLRSAARRRETYPGVWLPEPIVQGRSAEEQEIQRSELSVAFLFLLERLKPEERAVFLLREVSDCGYGEIAELLGKSEAACRQLMTRARAALQQDHAEPKMGRETLRELVPQYVEAVRAGDRDALFRLLANDAVLTGDGGGKAAAVINPVYGAERIVRFLLGLHRRFGSDQTEEMVLVNSEPGVLVRHYGERAGIVAFQCSGNKITGIYWIANPDKLIGTPQ